MNAALSDKASGPLQDLKILDLSRLVAGNFLTFHLAELGAQVIKVEDPKSGDPLRQFTDCGVSNTWKVFARNKKSIAVNLKSVKGQQIILALARSVDALIENFKPGGLEKFGLAPNVLHKINPSLVIVRVSGWGQTGPYSQKPGFGTLIEAFSGFAAKTGFPDSGPLLPNLGLADMITGTLGAYALMAAVREVEVNKGQGQVIDLSLLDSMASLLGADPAIAKINGKPIARTGNASDTAAPRNIYRSKDQQYLALSASMQSMVEKLFYAMDREDLIEDARFRTNADRVKHRDELDQIIGDFIAGKTLVENLAFFDSNGITAGPVNDAIDILQDGHVQSRQVYLDIEDPDAGAIPMPNVAPRFSATPGSIHSLAPSVGQHTHELLSSIGLDDEVIDHYMATGITR